LQQIGQLIRRDAGFGAFSGYVHLDERTDSLRSLSAAVDLLCQWEAIHRMNQVKVSQDLLGLVSLETADEMPFHATPQSPDLGEGLLNVILPEAPQTARDGLLDTIRRNGLGDGHEFHTPGLSFGPPACRIDSLLDPQEILSDVHRPFPSAR
jgi:hypothetical protein